MPKRFAHTRRQHARKSRFFFFLFDFLSCQKKSPRLGIDSYPRWDTEHYSQSAVRDVSHSAVEKAYFTGHLRIKRIAEAKNLTAEYQMVQAE